MVVPYELQGPCWQQLGDYIITVRPKLAQSVLNGSSVRVWNMSEAKV